MHNDAGAGNDAASKVYGPAQAAAAAAAQAEEQARQVEEAAVAGFEEQNAWMDTYRCTAAARCVSLQAAHPE